MSNEVIRKELKKLSKESLIETVINLSCGRNAIRICKETEYNLLIRKREEKFKEFIFLKEQLDKYSTFSEETYILAKKIRKIQEEIKAIDKRSDKLFKELYGEGI